MLEDRTELEEATTPLAAESQSAEIPFEILLTWQKWKNSLRAPQLVSTPSPLHNNSEKNKKKNGENKTDWIPDYLFLQRLKIEDQKIHLQN